jgi:CheY-like chemotaxis protein
LRILIAEDDEDTTNMYRIVLEARGHNVLTTNNGRQCLEVYRLSPPYDVVILDYKIPKLDGLSVAREILEINTDQRIVFISAYVKETLAQAVKGLQKVVELINKPFEPDLLADLIEDKLSLSKLRELNVEAREILKRSSGPSDDEIDNLSSQLKSIQKPNTI